MLREFISTLIFDKRWRELNLNDNDLQELQNYMMTNLLNGDIIEGTGGAIKLRWSITKQREKRRY